MMLISNGICQYEGENAVLNKNIRLFWDRNGYGVTAGSFQKRFLPNKPTIELGDRNGSFIRQVIFNFQINNERV